MKIITGQSVYPAVVVGKLRFCLRPPQMLSAYSSLTPAAEMSRFHRAQRAAIQKLEEHRCRAAELVGEKNASIFSIYAMLAADEDYEGTVHSFLLSQKLTAEHAVFMTGENFAAAFASMNDDYMRARAADMRNVANLLITELIGCYEPEPEINEPCILVDHEFSPSRTLMLSQEKLVGMVSRQGSINSHAAELACALHIPSMVQADLLPEVDGHVAILDGFAGRIYIDPTPEQLELARQLTADVS